MLIIHECPIVTKWTFGSQILTNLANYVYIGFVLRNTDIGLCVSRCLFSAETIKFKLISQLNSIFFDRVKIANMMTYACDSSNLQSLWHSVYSLERIMISSSPSQFHENDFSMESEWILKINRPSSSNSIDTKQ